MEKVKVHRDHTEGSRNPHFYERLTPHKQLVEAIFFLAKPFRRYAEMD